MLNIETKEFKFYALINGDGNFYTKKQKHPSWSIDTQRWVDFENARIYTKLSTVKAQATYLRDDNAKIVEFTAKDTKIIGRTDYIKKYVKEQREIKKIIEEGYKFHVQKIKIKEELEELKRLKEKYEN